MKKYIIYSGLLAAGLLIGWALFGGVSTAKETHDHTETSVKNQQWTCSMHPQIMQPEPGDCPICGMDLIPAETSAEGLAADQFKLTKNAMALANIQTAVVGDGMLENTRVKLSGKIVENEEENVVQVSYFSGRIEKLHISTVGEKVQKGQLLATVYSPELVAAQQELLIAMSLKESQSALYKAVRNKLQLWKFSEAQINSIESAEKVIENFPLYATVSGTVSAKLVTAGAAIQQGQPLFEIANFNTVWAEFDVYENQLHLFKKGQKINITTNAMINTTLASTLSFIDPILNEKTRVVIARAVLNNVNNVLKPGMFVAGEIEVKASKKEIIRIPETAVLWTGKRSVVYVKTNPNEPVFEMREITLGVKMGSEYNVLEGLENGDEIVTSGTFTVDAAAQLQGKKSMMNKEEAAATPKKRHVSKDFQNQLSMVFNAYINLKDALVADDSVSSKAAAKKLLGKLQKVDAKLLVTADAKQWMKFKMEIKTASHLISETTIIKEQRVSFNSLSSALTAAVALFGISEKAYEQFCPMADNNNGAYWLSTESAILNPYFGKSMLSCGEVKRVLK